VNHEAQDETRILAILGSPRRGGNTDTLTQEFLRGAAGDGDTPRFATRTIIPSDLGLAPCDGDNRCSADGRCVIADGMNEIYEEVVAAPRLLVATPVYFMGPPGSLKCFIDRFQAVWARAEILKTFNPDDPARRRRHRAFAIYACAAPDDPKIMRPAVSIVKAFCNVAGFDYTGELIAAGLEDRGDAAERPDLLKAARAAGRAFFK
jgi:putative NADPH-quinone reductase